MAFFYSLVLTVYLSLFRRSRTNHLFQPIGDIVGLLTYRQRYKTLKEAAITDTLTGVFNRNHFENSFEREVDRSRGAARPLSLILLDLDQFKAINDQQGHQEGDRVLSETGALLIRCLRSTDLAFRYGGEEFVLVLPGMEKARARVLADRILAEIRARIAGSARATDSPPITATLGVASFPDEASSSAELMDLADKRLYAGKRAGRNRVVDVGNGG
jgi:diguanylate cyclase (GGDEF)-like protein